MQQLLVFYAILAEIPIFHIPEQHRDLIDDQEEPAHGVAEGQGFNIHLHHQHKQRSGGDAAAHVQQAADKGDLQIAQAMFCWGI